LKIYILDIRAKKKIAQKDKMRGEKLNMEKLWIMVETISGYVYAEATYMTWKEFCAVREELDSPEVVLIKGSGEVWYNDFTCLSSWKFGGTCRCINHPAKSWTKLAWKPIENKKVHRDLILNRLSLS
jgi:hypothetical protein